MSRYRVYRCVHGKSVNGGGRAPTSDLLFEIEGFSSRSTVRPSFPPHLEGSIIVLVHKSSSGNQIGPKGLSEAAVQSTSPEEQ